ncbi:MAG: hypothetical protein AUG49_02620 [Catenulispora sp. 13_1_20CM_3_70_7]|nr:MAG: hypothetical protein AUG49_02620 [Catenulispora sp. 13_1_20CM_3_70_7]
MGDVLAELGKKVADLWLTTLLLPGLLLVAAVVCGGLLGQGDALDHARLAAEVQRRGSGMRPWPTALVLVVIAVLLAAAAAGLLARALGDGVNKLMMARRPQRCVRWRRDRAVRAAGVRTLPAAYLPQRVTAAGDSFRLVGARVDAQYGLSVTRVWPRLWLLLSEQSRAPLVNGYASYQGATRLIAWGLLYIALGVVWWPAGVAGAVAVVAGYRRATAAAAAVADLIEATVDVHQLDLAAAVGIPLAQGRLTPAEGAQIDNILNKRG